MFNIKTIFSFVVTVLITVVSCEDVIVKTKQGPVAGKIVKSIIPNEAYHSFLGIPYALPPVGSLRFMPPEPHPVWTDVLECKKEKSSCAQIFTPARYVKNIGFYGNEDCLYLNIHTPKLPTDKNPQLPVIVFLINDQFKMSYNVTKDFGPDFFMKEDVIIVTLNHRLGALGFLCFEDDLLPGNNALRDVILALTWVQDNAEYFGGDPRRVTLMGSQGGAVIADILLHTPKARGLFSKVMLQSGTSWNGMYFGGKGRKRAKELAEELDIDATSSKTLLAFLEKIPAEKIIESEYRCVHADEARAIQRGVPPFIPVVEHEHNNALITKLPEETELDLDIPIMIGYNSRESMDICERYLQRPQFLTFADRDFLLVFPIRTDYHFKINDRIYFEAVQEAKDYYFKEGYVKISKPGEYMTYLGDILQFYAIDYTVQKYTNSSKAPVYYYTFDYSGEWNVRKSENLNAATNTDGTWGASVTDELCYLFVCNKNKKAYISALNDPESEEMEVLRNMVKLWTNFAKTGNPTPVEKDFKWLPATKENKECLLINENLEMRTNLHAERIEFWDKFIEKYRQKAVNGIVQDIKDEL